MKHICSILLLSIAMRAQNFVTTTVTPPEVPGQPAFWTVENRIDMSVLAALVAADGITTQRGLNEGLREANPIMRPFVTRGAGGEAVGSALGFAAAVGAVYLLHRTHHYKRERAAMRLMLPIEGGFVVNNIIAIR